MPCSVGGLAKHISSGAHWYAPDRVLDDSHHRRYSWVCRTPRVDCPVTNASDRKRISRPLSNLLPSSLDLIPGERPEESPRRFERALYLWKQLQQEAGTAKKGLAMHLRPALSPCHQQRRSMTRRRRGTKRRVEPLKPPRRLPPLLLLRSRPPRPWRRSSIRPGRKYSTGCERTGRGWRTRSYWSSQVGLGWKGGRALSRENPERAASRACKG